MIILIVIKYIKFYFIKNNIYFYNNIFMMDTRLLSLVIMLFVNFTSFLVLNQYFSHDALYKNISIPMIGFILSTYPFGNIFASIYIGKNMIYYGKKNLLIKCSWTLCISYLIFAVLEYIFNYPLYIFLAIIGRSLQGVAVGGVCTIAYSYIGVLFPER